MKYSGRGERTLRTLVDDLSRVRDTRVHGRVTSIMGMLVEIGGVQAYLSVGDRCDLIGRSGDRVPCEVVGFRDGRTLAMSFSSLVGIGLGATAEVLGSDAAVYPHDGWLGRVVNAFGEPLDDAGPLTSGPRRYPIHNAPPPATMRQRVGEKLDLGVRSVNTFLTCCKGQRLGIFSGSGVGKSVLLSMLARYCAADVVVIGLVGERGREVKEFIEQHLGPEGLARSVVVVATSDESALMRRQAAYLTMTVAEHFRDKGRSVLCLIDSITRFAMAQREIGLSAGEPPASKGYTPTVFAELPKLLERAGPGTEEGTITGLFTVLVEGDDHNEPISDAVRGIVDGHVVLDRSIAQRNRYPAINVLQSISRTMPACNTTAQNQLVDKARQVMSVYDDMAELIRLGAYRSGSDPAVDEAVALNAPLEAFLSQNMEDRTPLDEGYAMLADILGMPWPPGDTGDATDTADDAAAVP